MSQKQNFSKNHLGSVPLTPNQQGTMQSQVEVLSCVVAQDMNTSGFQVSDLVDTEFDWEDPNLKHSRDVRTRYSYSLNDFEMGSLCENPIPIDKVLTMRSFFHIFQQLQPQRCQSKHSVGEKSPVLKVKRECSRLCVKKIYLKSVN